MNYVNLEEISRIMSTGEEYCLYCKIPDLLREREWTLTQLSKETGIRIATLSNMLNMNYSTLNIKHLETIGSILGVASIMDLYEFRIGEGDRK